MIAIRNSGLIFSTFLFISTLATLLPLGHSFSVLKVSQEDPQDREMNDDFDVERPVDYKLIC